jgi:hypothetical protein
MTATITTPTKATTSSGNYQCTTTVSAAAGRTSIATATVEVLWFHNYTAAISGWDNTAGVLRTGQTTSKGGAATITSPEMPKGRGGCTALVRNVIKTGYTLSAQVRSNLQWTS